MEKQIEQLAKDMPNYITSYNGSPTKQHFYIEQRTEVAEALIKQGYRKQEQGEWIFTTEIDVDFYTVLNVATCSNCGEKIWYKCEKIDLYNYCPNCGAHMKGE